MGRELVFNFPEEMVPVPREEVELARLKVTGTRGKLTSVETGIYKKNIR